MNTLVFALESEGLHVTVSETSTSVEVFGQIVAFRIEEDLRLKERREVKGYLSTRLVNVYERSGNLAFRVSTAAKGNRAHWGDSTTKRLENLVTRCLGGIFRHARSLRIEKEEQRLRELEWERRRREEAERAQKAREEQQRLENLDECMANWQKAVQIRAFADAYQKMCEAKGEAIDPKSPKGEWLAWARRKADYFDPLKS